MSFIVLSQADRSHFEPVCFVATDMDGTLTVNGKFTPALLQMLEKLACVGIQVVIVTGRSAGWMSGLVHYLPIAGAIAENGGIFFPSCSQAECWLVPVKDVGSHRQQLAQMFNVLKTEFPQIQESTDNPYRLTDWTFDVQGLTTKDIEKISDRCQEKGWSITYSTVQVHIKLPEQTKAWGLLQVLKQQFPTVAPASVLTVGDSPNDESLFNSDWFPLSVGVANVQEYRDRLMYLPRYITTASEGKGFCELSQFLISKHG